MSDGGVVMAFLQDHLGPEGSREITAELGRESVLKQLKVTPLGLVSGNRRGWVGHEG